MSVNFADLATIIAGAVLIWWYAATAGRPQTSIEPSSAELAYLRSGDVLALLSSLAWLRASGAVSNAWNRRIVAIGPAPAGADPLTRAVHSSLRSSAPWSATMQDPRVAGELDRVRRRLIWRGLLLRENQRRRMRALAAIPAAGSLGFLLFVMDEHGQLTSQPWRQGPECLSVVVATLIMVMTPEWTHAGRRLVRSYRRRRSDLRPKHRSSWDGCDADQVALAVALYGTRALWAFDPDFARKADLPLNWGDGPMIYSGGPTAGL